MLLQSQFYTIGGKCINALSPKVMFYVPDFVEVEGVYLSSMDQTRIFPAKARLTL